MKDHHTIILTGGGSGGHITPVLSLAHELKKHDFRLIFIGLKGEKIALEGEYKVFDKVYYVTSGKFRRYHGESTVSHVLDIRTLALNARDAFKVLRGYFQSRRILKKVKPDLMFSKGGFVVVPVGLAAKDLKIPIITHDSDVVPGLANRMIGRWAVMHTTGLPAENYDYPKEKTRFVGIPVGDKLEPVDNKAQRKFKEEIDINPDDLVLLVGGAGLGAAKLNELALYMAPKLLSEHKHLTIAHITGATHEQHVVNAYKTELSEEHLKKIRVLGFTDKFYKYTGAADLVVTRAGATTVAELAAQHKATVLIPAPFLTGGHQIKNAEALSKIHAVEVFDNDIEPEKLLNKISSLLQNKQRRAALADNLGSTAKPDSAKILADIIIEFLSSKEVA